jgi:nicotinate-nucleotide adenylyltransferase
MVGLKSLAGIYGGTFDPPHYGHLILAEAAQVQLNLKRVIWILTRRSPHKLTHSITPAETRLQLLQLALEGYMLYEISRVEIDRPPPYYAVDTIRLLRLTYPDEGLVYLMGGDSLVDLPTWHKPEELVALCHSIGVLRRPGCDPDLDELDRQLPGLREKVKWIDVPPVEISASLIRNKIKQGLPYRHLVPPAVGDFIEEHRLYQEIGR